MDYILPATRDKLVALYSEGHRHYHNMEHIYHCFSALGRLQSVMTRHELRKSDIANIGTMIWFHDAVYAVGPDVVHGVNERNSAEMYLNSPDATNGDHWNAALIMGGILASANHTEALDRNSVDKSVQIFLDIDLCGMGETYSTFLENGENIRREYAWVDDDTFMTNRIAFFEKLMKRPYIYYNHVMRGMYEENTKNNINRWMTENK